MTGLDKIIKHIEDDASAAAEELILQAKKKAEQIKNDAIAEGEKLTQEAKAQSELETVSFLERAKSAATLQKKKMILTEKQKCISVIIEKAQEHLLQMQSEEYFSTILKMLPKYARGLNGEIRFSPRDLDRIPADLEHRIASVLNEKEGAALKISKESAKIKGGFLLIYDDVEENCSFEALLENQRDYLQDKIGQLLFEQQT